MIPRIIHYCWFGRGPMPELAIKCIESWHKYMPDYKYKLWNEDNFDINCNAYVKEAYEARKYAFVTDYVRLYALYTEGGIYMDTDVEVLKPYDDLLTWNGFIGFEGTKYSPVGTGTIACSPNGEWAYEQLRAYDEIHFKNTDGSFDLMTNPSRISSIMCNNGFCQNGKEQDYKDMHIFPVEYFCPRQTTGEVLITEKTYCDHHFMRTWGEKERNWKQLVLGFLGVRGRVFVIKMKRLIESRCRH